jgi:Ca2+-binding EF-hand superfamily protein
MRSFNLDLKHLEPVKSLFIKCDKNNSGKIYAKDLIRAF